jgi:hypothetical protein
MSKDFIKGETLGGVHQLPRVSLLGKWWWIDERLKEYRAVEAPLEILSFAQMDDKLMEADCC